LQEAKIGARTLLYEVVEKNLAVIMVIPMITIYSVTYLNEHALNGGIPVYTGSAVKNLSPVLY
jgi:hypothetical protein